MTQNRAPVTLNEKTGTIVSIPPIKLHSLQSVRAEAGRVYRDMRTGKLPCQEGTRLVYVLDRIREMIVVDEFERRLEALEEVRK